jgi:voltage-gated potassium channel
MTSLEAKKAIKKKLYTNRFYLLFITLLLNFFVPPLNMFPLANVVFKLFTVTIMLLSGANFIQENKKKLRSLWFIFGFINIVFALFFNLFPDNVLIENTQYILLFLFFVVITASLLQQIFSIHEVTADVIIGSFCGYLLLGIISSFIFSLIEISGPHSLSHLSTDFNERNSQVFYYAFTCLTTLGFGDIAPLNTVTQKLSVFTAASGQFYIAVVVAILISRFLQRGAKTKNNN